MTFLFYILLYLLGFLCLLPLSKKIPLGFLTFTSFMWGMLIWVVMTVFLLFLGLAYTWVNMALLLVPVIMIVVGMNFYHKTFSLSAKHWGLLFANLGVFSLIAFVVSNKNYIYATPDSFYQIYHGRVLAKVGLETWTIDQFVNWGVFVPVIQMTSHLLPGKFISGYQTLMAVTLLSVFATSIYQCTRRHFSAIFSMLQTLGLVLVFTSSTYFHHFFYIHTNLQAALFLFVGLYSYWHLLRNETSVWLIPGTAAIIGLGFTRAEGVMYSLLFLALVMGLKELDKKKRFFLVLPYSMMAFFWHTYIYFSGRTFGILTQNYVLIILLALLGFMLVAIFGPRMPKIWSALPKLLVGGLLVCLAFTFIIKSNHMLTSLTHVLQNLVQIDSWGWSWISAFTLFSLVVERKNKRPERRLLIYSISGYIVVVLLLSFARSPYRLGSTDSANRLLLVIQPIIFFYIATKADKLKEWVTALKKSY